MNYLVFDTETTGLPEWTQPASWDGQPHLASWCMIFLDQNLQQEFMFSSLVKPDGWTMPPAATAINGLTDEKLNIEGNSIDWPLSLLLMALGQGRTLVAHNLQFDSKIMRAELHRRELGHHAEQVRDGICTMRALTEACAIPHPSGIGHFKFPRLAEACKIILGAPLVGAHNARADALACADLLRALLLRKAA